MRIGIWMLALAMVAGVARAQTSDWTRVRAQKHGAKLIVETNGSAYGSATFDHCSLVSVDATALTCSAGRHNRLVFPMRNIDAIYGRQGDGITLWQFMVGDASVLLTGLAAEYAPLVVAGAIGLTAALVVLEAKQMLLILHIPTGSASKPLPSADKRILLYRRP
jgi:hypothetical protein